MKFSRLVIITALFAFLAGWAYSHKAWLLFLLAVVGAIVSIVRWGAEDG